MSPLVRPLLVALPLSLALLAAACGTTEKTVVVAPQPGSTVVVPPNGNATVVPPIRSRLPLRRRIQGALAKLSAS